VIQQSSLTISEKVSLVSKIPASWFEQDLFDIFITHQPRCKFTCNFPGYGKTISHWFPSNMILNQENCFHKCTKNTWAIALKEKQIHNQSKVEGDRVALRGIYSQQNYTLATWVWLASRVIHRRISNTCCQRLLMPMYQITLITIYTACLPRRWGGAMSSSWYKSQFSSSEQPPWESQVTCNVNLLIVLGRFLIFFVGLSVYALFCDSLFVLSINACTPSILVRLLPVKTSVL